MNELMINISKQNNEIQETTAKISLQLERETKREEKLEKMLEEQKKGVAETNDLISKMIITNKESLLRLEDLRADSQSRLEKFSFKVDQQSIHTEEVFKRLISSIDEHNEQTERRLRYLYFFLKIIFIIFLLFLFYFFNIFFFFYFFLIFFNHILYYFNYFNYYYFQDC